MAKKRSSKTKSTELQLPVSELLPPVSELQDGDESEAAKFHEMSVMPLRLYLASGAIPPDAGPVEKYQELATSHADVANAIGVHERTVATWKKTGMPTVDGKYPIACIRHWRIREHHDFPEWLFRGNKELPDKQITGDLARAIFRMYRTDVNEAARRVVIDFQKALEAKIVNHSDPEQLADLLGMLLLRQLQGLFLSDAQIEDILVETWGLL